MAIKRTSYAEWIGGLKDGEGKMKVGKAAFEGKFSFASRFEDGEGTNPEELIAAAYAGCFSMFLSAILEKDGYRPESIQTEATVHLELKEEGPRITKIEVKTRGKVPGIDAEKFARYVQTAKDNCPVAIALGGVPEKVVEYELV